MPRRTGTVLRRDYTPVFGPPTPVAAAPVHMIKGVMRRTSWLLTALAISVSLVACGGSSKSTPTTSQTTTSAPTTPSAGSATTSSVTSGPVHAILRGENHAPVVNQNWPFTVNVASESGRPLAGTVTVQFVFAGQVVGRDIPPTHTLRNGRWHELLKFPARAIGIPLLFQTVVRTTKGDVTLSWPVKTRR